MKLNELEAYPDQDTLALEVDISNGELVGERHFGWLMI